MGQEKAGLLIVNLGTPAASTPAAVAPYLREFLMDPYVLRMPWPLRWFLVHVLIVPRRARDSAKLYRNVWTEAGSPLLVNSRDFTARLRALLPEHMPVELAMRYGQPSLRDGLQRLLAAGIQKLVIFPMYPQYALSSVETCLDKCASELAALGAKDMPVEFVTEFFKAEGFIDPLAKTVQRHWEEAKPDHVLFSFHGLPESHIHMTDPTGRHCFSRADCCADFQKSAPHCYRAQGYYTAHEVARRAGISPTAYSIAFQSRLGREPWLKPYTDVMVAELAQRGVKHLAVACPAFVADCLETLEEISFRAQDIFEKAGGRRVTLIPCLNADAAWVQGAKDILEGWPRRPLAERPAKVGFR